MKLYRTKSNSVINLEEVTLIHRNPDEGDGYFMLANNGRICELVDFSEEDIDRIMEYNNHFIDFNNNKII